MGLFGTVVSLSASSPRVRVRSALLDKLAILAPGADPSGYAGLSLIISSVLCLATAAALAISGMAQVAVPGALLAFSASFGFLLYLPSIEMKKRIAEIESELPFFLRNLGILLDLNVQFRKAMDITASGEGTLNGEMRKALSQCDSGVTMQGALSSFALAFDSMKVKRAIAQLLSAYEVGSGGAEIRKIGDDILALERHSMKEYASKSAMFGLLFIVTSAIFPAFFLVYAILGKSALGSDLGDAQVAFAVLILFPSISALIMMVSRSTMPRFALMHRSRTDLRILIPGLVFVLGFLTVPSMQYAIIVIGLAIAGYISYEGYARERRLEEIEERLPDALFLASGLPRSTRPERLFSIWEGARYGPLSEEAGKTRRQLSMNLRPELALDDLWKRNGSPLLRRASSMLSQLIATNSLEKMGLLADDMMAASQLKRERSQAFSMQKYTLIFGSLLLPLILKMTLSLLASMGEALGEGGDPSSFASTIVPAYLVIYSMIASVAIADSEGKGSLGAVYFAVLCAISLSAFLFISF